MNESCKEKVEYLSCQRIKEKANNELPKIWSEDMIKIFLASMQCPCVNGHILHHTAVQLKIFSIVLWSGKRPRFWKMIVYCIKRFLWTFCGNSYKEWNLQRCISKDLKPSQESFSVRGSVSLSSEGSYILFESTIYGRTDHLQFLKFFRDSNKSPIIAWESIL